MGIIFLIFQVLHLVLENVFHLVLIIYDIRRQFFLHLLKIVFPLGLELVYLVKLGNYRLQVIFFIHHFDRQLSILVFPHVELFQHFEQHVIFNVAFFNSCVNQIQLTFEEFSLLVD